MPQIGKEITLTLRVWKETQLGITTYYASIVEPEARDQIRELLKEHSGLRHPSIQVSL
ncbi:hypothetical protein LCGC14_1568420 [marine sediment metagenome]|uniref:Uncharacterized protein n=1 Tax=marine sediment metagenome TaxID=412755 RepID=A0A0F9IKD9_9ZZZZ